MPRRLLVRRHGRPSGPKGRQVSGLASALHAVRGGDSWTEEPPDTRRYDQSQPDGRPGKPIFFNGNSACGVTPVIW